MIAALLAGALGAYLWWQERDDETERIGGLGLTSGFWSGAIIVLTAVLMTTYHVELERYTVALALFVYVLTGSHNLTLSPPSTQVLGKTRDPIQRAFFWAFRFKVGDRFTRLGYWAYSAIRYAMPVSGMGVALGNMVLVEIGPVVSLVYYPWVHSERSKYVRAAVTGGMITAAMVYGAHQGWGSWLAINF